MMKPSRSRSNGEEMPRRDSAPMRLNAARQSPVSAASEPPATTTSASPRWIMRVASPIACAPVAQALATDQPGPWAPSAIATAPAAAFGIIIGTKSGETARSPLAIHASHSRCSVTSPRRRCP